MSESLSLPHALVIDDDTLIHPLIQSLLQQLDIRSDSLTDPYAALDYIRRQPPDLILLDYDMPEQTGFYLLDALKSQVRTQHIPVILMTSHREDDILHRSFELGVDDFIHKPIHRAEFQFRIRSVFKQRKLLEQLANNAHYDALTGLANRKLLLERVNHAIGVSSEHVYESFALLYMDFDGFKSINDSLGHEAGDQLLIEIASRLTDFFEMLQSGTSFRHTIARLGGDEFVVLLSDSDTLHYAMSVAEELLDRLGEPYQLQADWAYSSASIGVYQHEADLDLSSEQILNYADIAMYEAKRSGKGCAKAFDQSLAEKQAHRVKLEKDLAMSIGTKRLYLAYQPIISLTDGSRQSVEALIRWQHPSLGILKPDQFISVAEASRLIMPLSEQVFELATGHFIDWYRTDRERCPKFVSLNLSQTILLQSNCVEILNSIVHDAGLRPDEVQLEVSENQLIHHQDAVLQKLGVFKRQGYRIALDEFGKGYSSLSCLECFEFDLLKLNKEFIFALDQSDRRSVAHIKCVLDLAANLGIPCAAVGVERFDQVAVLQDLGCDFGQGNYLSLPLTHGQLLDTPWTAIPTMSMDVKKPKVA